ncbi:MAG TPA: 2-oxo acid dehydrogenase subunit E2, partial [Cytophagaceae bacterium]
VIANQQKKDRKAYSLIAYLLWCFGKVIGEHKDLHAMRQGKKIVMFDEVDINVMLEKTLPGGIKIPVAYIVRSVNKKSYIEIHDELREAMKKDLSDNKIVKARRKIATYPGFIRKLIWRRIEKNPVLHKKHRGTAAFTAVGMFTGNRAFWASPDSPFPCTIAAGSMYDKVVYVDGELSKRNMWCLTLIVNHDIVDGAPATRFGDRFCSLIESGEGLVFDHKDVELHEQA